MVGSQIAEGLARFTVGRLRLIDHDTYKIENTLRHALPVEYDGWNKAIGLGDWLSKQVEGLHVEAVPRKLDDAITDQELDRWLAGADLIVAATDDRAAQRRIAQRASVNEIAALFPAVYPHQGGGEVVLQLGPEWPCFGCWDYFRRDTEQLRGQRALDLDAQPVIFQAEQLCLSYLDPGSKQDDLLRPERGGDAPTQLITVDTAGAPSFLSLTRRDGCPCCEGNWHPAEAAMVNTPAPLRSRALTGSPRAQTPAPPHDSAWRGIAVVGAIVVLIAFAALSKGGGKKHLSQQAVKAKAAQAAAQRQAEVNTRIGELRFMCIAGQVCNTDPVNHPLRLFIYGIEENLRLYLQEHGYTDIWSDNAGFVHGHALYSHEEAEKLEREKTVEYEEYSGGSIPTSPEQEEQVANEPAPDSGLIFTPLDSEHNWPQEPGLVPLGVPEGGQWEITWTLYNSQGQVVKELHHSLEVISCPVPESEQDSESEASEQPPTPCSEVIAEQQKRREEMEEKGPSLYYQPPPPPEFRLTT
jgi:hypothetical protein